MGSRSVVLLSHTHRHGDFVVGSHHLARELAGMGWRVAHVSTPYSVPHRLAGRGSRGRREGAARGATLADDGVVDLVPATVLPAPACSVRRLSHLLADLGFASPDLVLLDQPKLARLADRLGGRGPVVYRPTDLYTGRLARRAQTSALRVADLVVATSTPILDDIGPLRVPAICVENGVEFRRFAGAAPAEGNGVVYLGALDHRFAWSDLAALAAAHEGVPFRIYGPVPRDVPPLPGNVLLLGPVPYADVPTVLSTARVGLLPLTDRPENAGRSPMKLYEYLAAGLHVLASRTPVTGRLAPVIHTYGTPDEAAGLLAGLLLAPRNTEGQVVAREQDWGVKAREVVRFALGTDAQLL